MGIPEDSLLHTDDQVDPVAHSVGDRSAIGGIFNHQLAFIQPPVIAAVILGREQDFIGRITVFILKIII